jgi:hypothetical protein
LTEAEQAAFQARSTVLTDEQRATIEAKKLKALELRRQRQEHTTLVPTSSAVPKPSTPTMFVPSGLPKNNQIGPSSVNLSTGRGEVLHFTTSQLDRADTLLKRPFS